jgi:dienelactone hydrolase
MSFRNLSPQAMFEQLALEHRPQFAFTGNGHPPFEAWKNSALPSVLTSLGEFPEAVPPNPQLLAEWEQDGLLRQKWLIDVQRHLAATCLVNIPQGVRDPKRLPAILCWHGHGPYGKEAVMGTGSSPDMRQNIEQHNYNYGYQMAQKGFVTFAIDWIGAGERNDSGKPNWRNTNGGRDWCNLYYLNATMLGTTSLAINVTHGRAATDFVCGLPYVDPGRLGIMGLSGGGTMALWSALCDERFQAVEIICYSDLWAHFGFRDLNYCGMQIAPGLFKLVDLPDLQGLLAPRPLLIDIGTEDSCFKVDTAVACYQQVREIYTAAGCTNLLELDFFAGEHGWGGNKSEGFFRQHLGPPESSCT